ncbi:sensor histidine kinase, partial [Loktanella sp. DJP18]|uniref:sensor histidine kinase n=1 Tax=Loktanella sp. DJP18 TaxID=3409788 RepID=UPI003BB7EB36
GLKSRVCGFWTGDQNDSLKTISSNDFLESVARGAAESCGASDRVVVSIIDASMTSEEAHCLALIANELITNSCKHGLADIGGKINVSCMPAATELRLEVSDNGTGFDVGIQSRTSGLRLVRSLCRQISAKFEVANVQGAHCRVSFKTELSGD